MIRTLRSSNKRLLSVLVTLLLTICSYFSAIVFLDLDTHLNHLIFIFSIRIILSFIILNDIKLSWSAATARSYLKKNIIGFVSFLWSLPVFFLIFKHPPVIFRMLILELVLFLFMQNLAMFIYRFMYLSSHSRKTRTAVVYGAGKAGQKIFEELADSDYKVEYFIDDDNKAAQRTLEGVPVLKKERFIQSARKGEINKKDMLVIAMPSVSDKKMVKQFYNDLSPYFSEVRILPAINDILMDKSFFTQLREVDVKDLLARHPQDLDEGMIKDFIKGKRVLVTGGGGSIGSEICRQVCRYGAEQLIIIDHSEYDLYLINEELYCPRVIPVLQSVRHLDGLEKTFSEYRPQIVIHAAAYKHVPMVEYNKIEGITNNIIGTKNCIDLSVKYHVEKFVLISTDKAVRPTNVMGATKRICELYAQNMNHNGTEICSVRFGNVLGSSGSVIPKFKKQIQDGGPLTITHPDITRYFMLIPEACQLVLQAASIGHGGEILILDMGEPVRILDLAKSMLKLAGREDIEIKFTGLRPGEKLYEELLISETDRTTKFESITIAQARKYDITTLSRQIEELLVCDNIIGKLKEIVPEFNHNPNGS
ncbi:MAG: nucleoside-diphosphate sugar epimerase/dehydratase [Candidatus Delongbacteria bacterium]|jgi:FlaA1/EpsC-like NDP-sugar epimerase|nr:nucleoside-diphosphate sugar epimerase/dehydratase [Candidatus Delongbacteria bacterium]